MHWVLIELFLQNCATGQSQNIAIILGTTPCGPTVDWLSPVKVGSSESSWLVKGTEGGSRWRISRRGEFFKARSPPCQLTVP
jgi:hypothetical protein